VVGQDVRDDLLTEVTDRVGPVTAEKSHKRLVRRRKESHLVLAGQDIEDRVVSLLVRQAANRSEQILELTGFL
jgi:hypothetical protein